MTNKPVAWGRVIDGKAVTVSLEWTPANDEPLYATPPAPGAADSQFTEEQLLAGARAIFAADIGMPDWNSPHFKGFREDCFRYTRLVLEAAALPRADGGAK